MAVLRPVGADSDRLARQILDKRARLLGQVLAHWRDILGDDLARKAVPERIRRQGRKGRQETVLELRVVGAFGHELAHRGDEICQRLNAHLGSDAIDRIKLRQATSQIAGPPRRRHTAGDGPLGLGRVAGTRQPGSAPPAPGRDPDELEAALARLGAALRSRG